MNGHAQICAGASVRVMACAALVLALVGCRQEPVATVPSPEQPRSAAPSDPVAPAADYDSARDIIRNRQR